MSVLTTVGKVLLSGIIVVTASEMAQKSTIFGALIVSLPITSILALTYLYFDTSDTIQVAELARDILYLIIPSSILFVLLPFLLRKGWDFLPAMGLGIIATIICYIIMIYVTQGQVLDNGSN